MHPCVTVCGTENRCCHKHENKQARYPSTRTLRPAIGPDFHSHSFITPLALWTLLIATYLVQCRCPCQPLNSTPQRYPQDATITSLSKILSEKTRDHERDFSGSIIFLAYTGGFLSSRTYSQQPATNGGDQNTILSYLVENALLLSSNFGVHSIDLAPAAKSLLAVALCGYIFFLLGISIFASRRVETEADYLVAGRRLPTVPCLGHPYRNMVWCRHNVRCRSGRPRRRAVGSLCLILLPVLAR